MVSPLLIWVIELNILAVFAVLVTFGTFFVWWLNLYDYFTHLELISMYLCLCDALI